jgi:hypothetical protein
MTIYMKPTFEITIMPIDHVSQRKGKDTCFHILGSCMILQLPSFILLEEMIFYYSQEIPN